jgi:thiamine pyrophosphate-dependent acetolactate synthase large subunit-like protein
VERGTSARNIDIPIVGDCKSVLLQLCEAVDARIAERFQPWRQKLADGEAQKRIRAGSNYPTDCDIHPLWLCEEVKNFMQRDAILVVDGQEILNFGRQSIPTFTPGHRLNSGPFGTLGCYGEYVEQPEDIRPALERAQKKVDDGMVALVNVKTDYRARATTVRFSSRET